MRRVLIVLPNWVGDVVLASPALVALRERFRSARITFLCRRYVADVIRDSAWMDEIVSWPDGGAEAPTGLWALVRRLRREEFDIAILFPNSFRSAAAVWLGGAKRRVGYSREARGWMLTDRMQPLRNGRRFAPVSMLDYYNAIAQHAGCRDVGRRLSLGFGAADEQAIERRLGPFEPDRPLVVLNPGGAYGTAKLWPAERFAAVGDELTRRYGARVIVSGTPKEAAIAKTIERASREYLEICFNPPLGLGPLKSLIRRADLLVTNDTGPRHYAIAFDVPVVTIFGPTDPGWTESNFDRERKVLLALECQPCQEKLCPLKHNNCMMHLDVSMVLSAACELLDARISGRRAAARGMVQ